MTLPDPFRVIVTGDRYWRCDALARSVVARLATRHGEALVIVHGAAPGVDESFAAACEGLGVQHEPHPAAWEEHGRRAGPIRNGEMVRAGARLVLAFHPKLGQSKGTLDCCRQALAAGIPVWLVDGERATPRRITSA